ncbi:MAG TPA: hypothetical protein VN775_04750 [Opitutaceae bacterium]|nr:hypothetical protein [Opitutaceae bacterium]
MHTRSQFLTAVLVGLLVRAADASVPPPDSAGTESKAAAAAPKGPEAALFPEMPADAVIKIMGKPESVKPMKVPAGKAEVWVYARQVAERVDFVQVSTPVMGAVPNGNGTTRIAQTGEKLDNREEHHITTEVVELLMFNGHFVTQKVSRRESVKIY